MSDTPKTIEVIKPCRDCLGRLEGDEKWRLGMGGSCQLLGTTTGHVGAKVITLTEETYTAWDSDGRKHVKRQFVFRRDA